MRFKTFLVVALGSIAPVGVSQPQSPSDDAFADCEKQLADAPQDYASASCFRSVAAATGLWEEAIVRLEDRQLSMPENYWITLVRGHLERARHVDRVEGLYREAAEGFQRQNNARGELFSRYNLRGIVFDQGRVEDADREVERVVRVAESSADPNLLARAMTLKGFHFSDTGKSLAEAQRALRRAEAFAFPDGPYSMRREILSGLANLNFRLGDFEQAASLYARLSTLTREAEDSYSEASALASEAASRQTMLEEIPNSSAREELLDLARQSLVVAERSENLSAEAMSHTILGQVVDSDEEAEGHLRQCLALASEKEMRNDRAHCLWSLGHRLGAADPEQAQKLSDEGLALALDGDDLWTLAYAWRERLRLSWALQTRERALADSAAAIAAIESIRELQSDSEARAGLFSAWTREYYQLSGRLLEPSKDGGVISREDLEYAFEVIERMRGRVLLEQLTLSDRNSEAEPPSANEKKRREVLQGIVDLQRQLLDPRLSEGERALALATLEEQELEERRLRELASSGRDEMASMTFEKLSSIEETLRQDEAMLVFQTGVWKNLYGEFGGGSWLLLITRKGTEVFAIPDRVELGVAVPVFASLFAEPNALQNTASVALFRDLLGEALTTLPNEVDHLIVLPDLDLYSLPFAALRETEEASPLGVRYQVSTVPSASLWARWRRSEVMTPPAVLAIADPSFGFSEPSVTAEERGWSLDGAVDPAALGRLPNARKEGRAVLSHLRRGRLLVGEEASEAAFKSLDFDAFGIVHFASHALADAEHPERSAMLLAAGSEREDGLLQAREIGDLSLSGRVIVLSACRSGTGDVLSGEGVVGLASSFFQAGARAVVGSLWPLRDDHAAFVFDAFYRHLATGLSVAEAMTSAQKDAIDEGLPGSAWAGLLVMGDGTARPIQEPIPPNSMSLRFVVAGAVLLALLSFAWGLRRRISSRSAS